MPPKVTKPEIIPRVRLARGAKHEAPPPPKHVEWEEVESISPTLSREPSPEPVFVVPPPSKSKAATPKKAAPKKPITKKAIPAKKEEPAAPPKKAPAPKKKVAPTEEPCQSTSKTKAPTKKIPTPKKSTTSTKNTPKTITKKPKAPTPKSTATSAKKGPKIGSPLPIDKWFFSMNKDQVDASLYAAHALLHSNKTPHPCPGLSDFVPKSNKELFGDGTEGEYVGLEGLVKKATKKDLKEIMGMKNGERKNIFSSPEKGGLGNGEWEEVTMSRAMLPKEVQMLCVCGREGCVGKSICDPINYPWRFFTKEQFDGFEERALSDDAKGEIIGCKQCRLVQELGLDVPPTRNKTVRCECEPVWGEVLALRGNEKKTKGRKKIGELAKEKKKDPKGWRAGFEKRVREGYEKLFTDSWEGKDWPKGTDFRAQNFSPPELKGLTPRWNRSDYPEEPLFGSVGPPKKKVATPKKGKSPAGVKKTPTSAKKAVASAKKTPVSPKKKGGK